MTASFFFRSLRARLKFVGISLVPSFAITNTVFKNLYLLPGIAEMLRFLRKSEKLLKKAQRKLSKMYVKGKEKQSNRYYKQKHRVAILHEKVRHQRADWLHKESRNLINRA